MRPLSLSLSFSLSLSLFLSLSQLRTPPEEMRRKIAPKVYPNFFFYHRVSNTLMFSLALDLLLPPGVLSSPRYDALGAGAPTCTSRRPDVDLTLFLLRRRLSVCILSPASKIW